MISAVIDQQSQDVRGPAEVREPDQGGVQPGGEREGRGGLGHVRLRGTDQRHQTSVHR